MGDKLTYGILFYAEVIDGKNVLLKPYHIIEGFKNKDGNIVDKYDKLYKKMYSATHAEKYNDLFGFGIDAHHLQNYLRAQGYPASQTESSELCANLYLEFAKKYVYILERDKENKKSTCYAINLCTKEAKLIDINKNIMAQLIKDLIGKNQELSDNISDRILYNPKTLLENVKKRVIGQDEAAFKLVSTVCKNLKYSSYEGMKTNILLYGPTGCGKTELVRSLAKELSLPLVIEDVTNYTANGYVGDSVKNILRRLYEASNKNMKQAEMGIVFLDEFDKLASPNLTHTVNKIEVQEELLKIIEGAKINLHDSNKTNEQLIMDTSKITFILGGAFTKLLEEKKKKSKKNTIGFANQEQTQTNESINDKEMEITNEDFVKYGIIPELVGRISNKIPIRQLELKDLEMLLTKSSISCLKMYEMALLSQDRVKVVYENKSDFISKVALKADALNAGARGLKTVVDEMFLPAVSRIGATEPYKRELVLSSETIDNPKAYVLRKKKRVNNELSKGIREANQ